MTITEKKTKRLVQKFS